MISSSSLVPAPTLSFHSPRLYIYIVVLICAVGFLALERVALDDYHSLKVRLEVRKIRQEGIIKFLPVTHINSSC